MHGATIEILNMSLLDKQIKKIDQKNITEGRLSYTAKNGQLSGMLADKQNTLLKFSEEPI